MALLEYENQMFLELFQEDGLLVLAKGLGIERLLFNLIKTYSDPGNLVLIIGTSGVEEEYLLQLSNDASLAPLPKVITSEYGTKERYEVYMDGGVLFVSSRILVVDMLLDRLPIDLITGIIVYRAHKILESAQEAFIVRLYRMKNKTGFIKAVSGNPCSFTRGFSQIQRIMRNLFVPKLYLWPRFHAVVTSSMEKVKPVVFEIHVTMTHAMHSIQIAVLDLLNVSVKELKKINPSLDTDELTVENAIAKSFDKIIKYQLDPIWHQLSSKTRRLISDLKFLRSVLRYLTQYDCVSFYNLLRSVKENINVGTQMSDWLFLDASETLFIHAKERLYGNAAKKSSIKKNVDANNLKLEANPKWKALSEILKEISSEVKEMQNEMVVVIVEDEVISNQLKEVLTLGSKVHLSKLYDKVIAKSGEKQLKKLQKRKLENDEQTLTQVLSEQNDSESSNEDEQNSSIEVNVNLDSTEDVLKQCSNLHIEFYSLKHAGGSNFKFQTILRLHHSKYIVMYDGDMEIIRRIELHQSLTPSEKLKVYFLVYSGSAEEQCYLTILRREKEAFEFLIKEKAHMVLPEGIDGKSGDHQDLIRGDMAASETVNSRKAGGQFRKMEDQKIIVDMREFRSELPSLIHRRGIDVIPVTLEVGDYVLTPDICVERKSVSDLIGSLNSGRLYTQAQAMCRLYKKPILLIEFDQNKAFSLQGKYYVGSNSPQSLTSKLILLTCHFPALRILWCTSPYATSEMFELLKLKKEQPDVQKAMLLKPEGMEMEIAVDKYNPVGCDFISKLPGINSKNMWTLMNKLTCIADVVKYSEEELGKILSNSVAAKLLWESVHKEIKTDAQPLNLLKKPKKQWKSKRK